MIVNRTTTKGFRKGICETPISIINGKQDKLIIAVKNALRERGYQIPLDDGGYLDDLTRAAIEHYQIQNKLPICGKLEMETLRYLGIKVPKK